MYGLWLFKEIKTEYGHCKVEIFRKGYSGSQIEIGALAANSLTISLENLSEITAPVGKSVCSFEIIDTDQIAYDDFFTPDATYYKVVVSTKVGTGAYVTRWSGYITPDFFAENLTYRTPISISARDNIGYLNDVDFDLTASSITVRELIQSAFRKIAADYPMSLSFVSQKQTAEGILAIEATISTLLLKEMSWGEALETILHDLGLQMRWVDNNTIAVLDLSQIPEYYPTQAFNFIHSSGYREIAPAWRQLSQSQDYGLRENFFEGDITSRDVSFVKEEIITTSGPIFSGSYQTKIKYYTPKNWISAGAMYTINPADFFNGNELFKGRIYFTGILSNSVDYSGNYMSWRQPVIKSDWPMRIQFNASNAVFAPDSLGIGLFPPTLFGSSNDRYQLGLKVNVLLHSGTNTYVLRQDWELLSGEETDTIRFVLPEITSNSTAQEEELTIDVNRIPYDGDLEFRIYGFYLNPEYGSNVGIPEGSLVKMVSYISDVTYTYETKVIPTGQDTAVQINELHNVKSSQDYTFGEVPLDHGGINAYAGGLFKADGSELYGFQRNAEGQKYNLLELVGREIIHFNKDNYNRLSGTIKNLDKEPLMFNRLLVREEKTYYPYNCSLNVISNEMNITAMQEVEPYTTASFTEINSEVVTGGGATVGSGNNTVLQYSEEAGNVKRIYELEPATAEEIQDAEIIVDNEGWPEAKKYPASQLAPLLKRINVGTDEEPQWAVIPVDYEGKPVGIVSDTFITAGGKKSDDPNGTATTLGGLNNVDAAADDLQSEAVVLTKGVNATHWTLRALSTLGLNKAELENYLATNSYLKKDTADSLYATIASFNALNTKVNDFLEGSDTDAIINKWKELEAFLAGQTESSTLAELLAVKANQSALDAHIANYNNFVNNTYATHIAAYNTHISDYNSFKNTTNDRLVALESLWAIDEENNALYPRNSRGIWSYDFITAGGKANSGSSSGGLIQAVYDYNNLGGNFNNNNLTDTFNAYAINSIYNEVQKLKESAGSAFNETALWQSLAKVDATKVIDSSHIPDLSSKYLSLSGGTIIGELTLQGSGTTWLGFKSSTQDFGSIGLNKTGPKYWDGSGSYSFIHTGNYADTTDKRYLQLSGGTINGNLFIKNGLIISEITATRQAFFYKNADSLVDYGTNIRDISDRGNATLNLTYDNLRWNGNIVIHSGNIGSQSVNYATSASYLTNIGSPATDVMADYVDLYGKYGLSVIVNQSGNSVGDIGAYYTALNIGINTSRFGRFIFSRTDDSDSLYWQTPNNARTGWGRARKVAFLDSNVASAQNLTHSNGTVGATVEANGKVRVNEIDLLGSDGSSVIAYWSKASASDNTIRFFGKDANSMVFGTNNLERMRINESGNILIGTTNDSGVAKLQVNGGIHSLTGSSYLFGYGTSSATSLSALDNVTAIGAGKDSWNIYIWSFGNGRGCIQSSNAAGTTQYALLLQPFGGYIGMGTTNPQYELDVAGTGRFTNNVICDKSLILSQASGNARKNYISAGGGYSFNSGKYGVKILCCDQPDAQTGLGQDCFGSSYELSVITTRNGNNGRISFGYHYVDQTTYTRLGYFDINGFVINGTLNAGATTLNSLSVTNDATIGGTLGVTGKSTLGELSANATTLSSLGVSGDTTLAGLSAGDTEVSSLISNGSITGGTADFGSTTVVNLYSESYVRGGAARFTSLEIATWYLAQGEWKYGTINTGRIYFNTPAIEGAGLYSDSDTIPVHAGLNVDGTIDAYGDIFSEGEMTAGAIGSSSDMRLKNDIELLEPESAISLIMALKPSTWKWNCNSKLVGKRSYGLIAQEVAPYLPEAVMDNKDYLSLVYNQFHAFEISVLQNHETRLERVERENREMKCEIERLNKELNQYRRA